MNKKLIKIGFLVVAFTCICLCQARSDTADMKYLQIGGAIKAGNHELNINLKNVTSQAVLVSPLLNVTYSNSALYPDKKIFAVTEPNVIGVVILFVGPPDLSPGLTPFEGPSPQPREFPSGQSATIDLVSRENLMDFAKNAKDAEIYLVLNRKIIASADVSTILAQLKHTHEAK